MRFFRLQHVRVRLVPLVRQLSSEAPSAAPKRRMRAFDESYYLDKTPLATSVAMTAGALVASAAGVVWMDAKITEKLGMLAQAQTLCFL
mmetsp:Transcript_23005/g.58338  ORF Transcript_23005/g.58338 Transcript_23005/m.58338 type:complete len:89 (+) Transcript_23005:104-370(+)